MIKFLPPALVFAAGILLGAFYFGGLWWTVRRGVVSKYPMLWFAGSMLLRMIIVLVGFYTVGRGHWERLVICLVGFITARVFLTRLTLTRSPVEIRTRPGQEVRHAP